MNVSTIKDCCCSCCLFVQRASTFLEVTIKVRDYPRHKPVCPRFIYFLNQRYVCVRGRFPFVDGGAVQS